MARIPRYERLEGAGRIRAYDAGPNAPFMDRYLILFEDMPSIDPRTFQSIAKPKPYGYRQSLSMSADPDYPLGVSSWDYTSPPQTYGIPAGEVRWRRVTFASLPERVQRHTISRSTETVDI